MKKPRRSIDLSRAPDDPLFEVTRPALSGLRPSRGELPSLAQRPVIQFADQLQTAAISYCQRCGQSVIGQPSRICPHCAHQYRQRTPSAWSSTPPRHTEQPRAQHQPPPNQESLL